MDLLYKKANSGNLTKVKTAYTDFTNRGAFIIQETLIKKICNTTIRTHTFI